MSVVELKTGAVTEQPTPENLSIQTITALRTMLRQAEAGEINGVAAAVTYTAPGTATGYAFAGFVTGYNIIGALDVMRVRIIDKVRAQHED
jgi:hypothetical protein